MMHDLFNIALIYYAIGAFLFALAFVIKETMSKEDERRINFEDTISEFMSADPRLVPLIILAIPAVLPLAYVFGMFEFGE